MEKSGKIVKRACSFIRYLRVESTCLWIYSGGGSFAKLGAQYITRDPKIGCADSAFSLLVAQILGAEMRTLRTQFHRPCGIIAIDRKKGTTRRIIYKK